MTITEKDLHKARELRTRVSPKGAPLSIELVQLMCTNETIIKNIMRRRIQRNKDLPSEKQLPTFLCSNTDKLDLTKTSPYNTYLVPACLLTADEVECLYMVYDQMTLDEGIILTMSEPYTTQDIEFLEGIYNCQYYTWSNSNRSTFVHIKHKLLMQMRNCFMVPPTK